MTLPHLASKPDPITRLRAAIAAFPGQKFAVVDGGLFDDLPTVLKRERLFARSLFLGQGDRGTETFGPWLISLDQEAEATDKVIAVVGDKPAAIFWSCGAGEAVLYRHLRTINMARIPTWAAEGKEMPGDPAVANALTPVLFRHYDPRVLGALMPCLDDAQFSRFLGPAEELAFVAADFGGFKRILADKSRAPFQPGMLTIGSTQIHALAGRRLSASHRRIMAYLRDVAPDQTKDISDDELLYQIEYSEAVGRDLGIRNERAHAQWAFLMVTSKGQIANEARVTSFIGASGRSPDRQVDEAMRQAVRAARERDGMA